MTQADHAKFLEFIQSCLPAWKSLTEDQVDFVKFDFGLSRAVYKVTPKVGDIPSVILRQYLYHFGNFAQAREKEVYVFKAMGDLGVGPKLYAANNDLRVEEYIPSRTIRHFEIDEPIIRRKLAVTMAEYHKVKLDKLDSKGYFVKMFGDASYFTHFDAQINKALNYSEEELKFAEQIKFLSSAEQVEYIKNAIASISAEQMVTAHNDIWAGNILLHNNGKDTTLIDYEQTDTNFQGYDLGKLLTETMFVRNSDNGPYFKFVPENYPSDEHVKEFAMYYLAAFYTDFFEKKTEDKFTDSATVYEYLQSQFKEQLESKLQQLLHQITTGAMIAGYFCCMQGIRIGKNPNFKFDFLYFAQAGWEIYKQFQPKYEAHIK